MTAKRFFLPPTLCLLLGLGLSLSLTGCGALSTLSDIVTASEAAIPILQAAGVPIPSTVTTYLADVNQCIAASGAADPTTAQLLAISSCLAMDVAPTLTGLPGAVAKIIGQVIADVGTYLTQTPAPTPAPPATAKKSSVLLSGSAAAQLHALAQRAGVVVSKCHAALMARKSSTGRSTSWSMGAEGAVSVPHETQKTTRLRFGYAYLSSSHLAVARPNRTISALSGRRLIPPPAELAGVGRRLNLLSPLLPQRPRHW